jgi:hypothetical protein
VQVPLKHWTEGSGWEMAENLFNVVQARMKKVVSTTSYFSIICDEMTRWTTNLGLAYIFTQFKIGKECQSVVLAACD